MNTNILISVLVQSNWLFLAGWILLLTTAFMLSFPEKLSPPRQAKKGPWQNRDMEE